MNRLILAAVIGVAYAAWRIGIPAAPAPTPAPTPAAVPFPAVAAAASRMTVEDKTSLAQAYGILERAIQANTVDEPVFPDTASVRRAHRACMLYVWRAVLKNQPGEVDGLREALEGAVAQRIGTEDVPLNPVLQQDAAKAFSDIAASLK